MLNLNDDYLVVNILESFLGAPKSNKDAETKIQWEFNCPSDSCRYDQNKFNLAYHAKNKVFKCWKCKYSGVVTKLVSRYGTSEDKKRLKLILPDYKIQQFNVFRRPEINYDLITCDLPDGYLPLNKERQSKLYKLAYDYVTNERKITTTQIDKYKIGYAETGPRKLRIIFPSYNSSEKINYFEARAFLKNAKTTYLKPDYPDKQDIIFNEKFINWDLPVYLVEGVFDAIRLPNSIPMLGKIPSELLFNKLIKHNSTVIICLDSDAVKDGISIYSLGLNVFFIDLKGKKDISKIFEDDGQEEINKLLKTICRIDTIFELNKLLN